MGFFDVFKGKQYKKELEELKKSKMSIEQMNKDKGGPYYRYQNFKY